MIDVYRAFDQAVGGFTSELDPAMKEMLEEVAQTRRHFGAGSSTCLALSLEDL